MKSRILILYFFLFGFLNTNAQIYFTPNSADLGETLQVFISGNSPSDFDHPYSSQWSGTVSYLRLAKDNMYDYESFEVPNNSSSWVYNSSVGSYGFYSTITVPGDFSFTGNYNLYVDECSYCWYDVELASNVFSVSAATTPFLGSISGQDEGNPGDENLYVTISGGNIDIGSYYSSTANNNVRFSQYSGTNTFYSTVDYWYDCSGQYSYWNGDPSSPCQTFEVYNVGIPWGQPVGD